MGGSLTTLRTRARAALKNRVDLDTNIDQSINDQLKEITSNIRFPEMEVTGNVGVFIGPINKIAISDLIANGTDELMAVINLVDVTSSSAPFPLDQDDVRELDRSSIKPGIPKRYARFGTDLLLDATMSERSYRMRYRKYHDTLSGSASSALPAAWDEVIALGAALRVARDIISDYDLADEIEKQFTRATRARGLTKEEETRDADFGLQVVL